SVAAGERRTVSFSITCAMRELVVTMIRGNLQPWRMYRMNRDGSAMTMISGVAANPFSAYTGDWSPDGTRIVFTRSEDIVNLWVMASDGSNQRQLTSGAGFQHAGAWSPDGTRIAYGAAAPDAPTQITVVNADGTNVRTLTQGSVSSGNPRWSADGTRLVFFSGVNTALTVESINADGTNRR